MRRRGIWIIAGAVVLVAVVGAAWWFASRPPSAQDAAEAYLRALESGDLPSVRGLSDGLDADADAERLVEDAFEGASAYVTGARVERVREQRDGVAVIDASAELDGRRHDLTFELRRGPAGWRVTGDQLGSLTVNAVLDGTGTTLPRVRVGSAMVPTATPIALLPAVYTVTATPAAVLTGTRTIPVTMGDAVSAELAVAFSPDATAAAQEQVDAYATACTAPATTVPSHCGLVIPWPADLVRLDRLAFRVEKLPTVALLPAPLSFAATGGVVVVTAYGTAHDGTEGSATYRTDEWALRGSVAFDDDAMILSVR